MRHITILTNLFTAMTTFSIFHSENSKLLLSHARFNSSSLNPLKRQSERKPNASPTKSLSIWVAVPRWIFPSRVPALELILSKIFWRVFVIRALGIVFISSSIPWSRGSNPLIRRRARSVTVRPPDSRNDLLWVNSLILHHVRRRRKPLILPVWRGFDRGVAFGQSRM